MESLNKIMLIGRLIEPPITTNDGVVMTQFLVETIEKRDDGTTHINRHLIVAFSEISEKCKAIRDVGRLIYVEGKLSMEPIDIYDIRKTPSKKIIRRSKIIAHTMSYCDING